MRCFIENDPVVGNVPRMMVLKRTGIHFDEYFDHIICNAYLNMDKVIKAIESCDEIYVDTTYPIISGISASMLDSMMMLAIRYGWCGKVIINIRPRGMMAYTELQMNCIKTLEEMQDIRFEYIGE